jgi:putative transposase
VIFYKRPVGRRAREEYAVREPITKQGQSDEGWDDPLVAEIRPVVREAIELSLKTELIAALGARWYDRVVERRGYRNGSEERELGTPLGRISVEVPRARLIGEDGRESEWHSGKLPRHSRRLRGIDKAVLSIYLSGTNQRRIQAALRPLLKGLPLSKSSVSRLVSRLQAEREAWMERNLSEEKVSIAYLDGFVVKVRRDGRVVRNPVLVVIGVREGGEKVLLALSMAGGETSQAWRQILEDLARRGLVAPVLAVLDGSPGLRAAVEVVWSGTEVQRCVVHKLRNVLSHAPRHAKESVREDFHAIIYAKSGVQAQVAYERFVVRWRKRCEAVARSLEEGGSELLTFYRFPEEMWKCLRTTNLIERVHGEMRRRVKTQAALPNEEAVLNLVYGLFVAGIVRLRRLDGWRKIAKVMDVAKERAA